MRQPSSAPKLERRLSSAPQTRAAAFVRAQATAARARRCTRAAARAPSARVRARRADSSRARERSPRFAQLVARQRLPVHQFPPRRTREQVSEITESRSRCARHDSLAVSLQLKEYAALARVNDGQATVARPTIGRSGGEGLFRFWEGGRRALWRLRRRGTCGGELAARPGGVDLSGSGWRAQREIPRRADNQEAGVRARAPWSGRGSVRSGESIGSAVAARIDRGSRATQTARDFGRGAVAVGAGPGEKPAAAAVRATAAGLSADRVRFAGRPLTCPGFRRRAGRAARSHRLCFHVPAHTGGFDRALADVRGAGLEAGRDTAGVASEIVGTDRSRGAVFEAHRR